VTPKVLIGKASRHRSLPNTRVLELLGELFTAGGSLFGVAYSMLPLAVLTATFRGGVGFSTDAQAALGLAALVLTVFGSFAALIIGQLRASEADVGASLVFWTNFAVVLLGDVVFYWLQPSATAVMLVGLISAALTVAGLLVIAQRQPAPKA
jgi:hypothetical protein